MNTSYYPKHAAPVYGMAGPTGAFGEVLRGEVRDYGQNTLFCGTADECLAEQAALRIPTRLFPTEWRKLPGHVAGADVTWQPIIFD